VFAGVIILLYFFSVIIHSFNRTGVRSLKRPEGNRQIGIAAIEKKAEQEVFVFTLLLG
jgi:hypothetical protein